MSKFERAVSEALIWIALFHAPISIGHTCTNLLLLCTVHYESSVHGQLQLMFL